MMVVEILQLNAGKRRSLRNDLNAYLQGNKKRRIKAMLLQEPPTIKGKKNQNKYRVSSLQKGNMYYDGKGEAPRAAIYVDFATDKASKVFMLSEFTGRDQVAVQFDLTLPGGAVIKSVLCSIYLPGDTEDFKEDLNYITNIKKYCDIHKRELIIGGDFNSHNKIWGDTKTTTRGDETLELIIREGLYLLNKGTTPTYDQGNGRTSVIDLTLATKRIAEKNF